MMLRWLKIVCVCWIASTFNPEICSAQAAQDSLKILKWEVAVNMSPDSVFAIDASHLKWERIPEELFMYTNIIYLDLSKNKLTQIPDAITTMKKLKALNVSHNKLSGTPVYLCQLTNLVNVNIGRNEYSSIPECIGFLSNLKTLNLWSNPIGELPEELYKCKNLKTVDMRGIVTGPTFQAKWIEQMPDVKWEFDPPCHCVE